MKGACVYVVRNADNETIYVGMSLSLHARIYSHSRQSGWFDMCKNIEVIHCQSKSEAEKLEMNLIKSILPRFNKAYTPNAKIPKCCCSVTKRKIAYELFKSHLRKVFENPHCNIEKDETIERILSGKNKFTQARRDYFHVCRKVCMPMTAEEYYAILK